MATVRPTRVRPGACLGLVTPQEFGPKCETFVWRLSPTRRFVGGLAVCHLGVRSFFFRVRAFGLFRLNCESHGLRSSLGDFWGRHCGVFIFTFLLFCSQILVWEPLGQHDLIFSFLGGRGRAGEPRPQAVCACPPGAWRASQACALPWVGPWAAPGVRGAAHPTAPPVPGIVRVSVLLRSSHWWLACLELSRGQRGFPEARASGFRMRALGCGLPSSRCGRTQKEKRFSVLSKPEPEKFGLI